MPAVLIWGLGMVGAALAGRWIVREYARVNAQLHPASDKGARETERGQTLERDPETGIYRPK